MPKTPLPVEAHLAQKARWPAAGQHILAHHDVGSVVVYQAYRPEIGEWAVRHGRLDGPHFSLTRMSWIKPNFLWMMYRSGWGTKAGQEITLGLRLRRAFFERLVHEAVASTFTASDFARRDDWDAAVARSQVRVQWDPDHAPNGAKLQRRALQLGLRGNALVSLASGPELLEVIDMSDFVAAQRVHAQNDNPDLLVPIEHPLTFSGRTRATTP